MFWGGSRVLLCSIITWVGDRVRWWSRSWMLMGLGRSFWLPLSRIFILGVACGGWARR